MYYVIRLLENKGDCFGTLRWTCFKIIKLYTERKMPSGRKYLNGFWGIDVSCGFLTEKSADIHIRYPLCYPDSLSAKRIEDAPCDRYGWTVFWNPVSGINDPDNSVLLLEQMEGIEFRGYNLLSLLE